MEGCWANAGLSRRSDYEGGRKGNAVFAGFVSLSQNLPLPISSKKNLF
jgi:hypothetical protein